MTDPGKACPAVLVNMLWCVPGEVGGSEEYLIRQLVGLTEQPSPAWLPTIAGARGLGAAHPELTAALTTIEPPLASERRPVRMLVESTWLRGQSKAFALVHHGGGTAPAGARRPFVVTVHDLQWRTFPEHFSATKRRYLGVAVPSAIRRAGAVAVPSDYVRTTLIDAYGADESTVMVVPHGLEPGLLDDVTPEEVLRRRYALGDGPVLVYPAVTHPHKHHAFLLEMMEHHWTDPDLRLVLCGGRGGAEGDITRSTDRRVVRTGRVPAADRNGLLAMATAMVFPSRYEGFGAPLIEAMALGAPVVCADTTCMPDIVGDAGIVLPLDHDAWAGVLDTVSRRRTELITAGRVRARQYTSARSGAALAAVYERALGS